MAKRGLLARIAKTAGKVVDTVSGPGEGIAHTFRVDADANKRRRTNESSSRRQVTPAARAKRGRRKRRRSR